jgi:hypothetical protein
MRSMIAFFFLIFSGWVTSAWAEEASPAVKMAIGVQSPFDRSQPRVSSPLIKEVLRATAEQGDHLLEKGIPGSIRGTKLVRYFKGVPPIIIEIGLVVYEIWSPRDY